MCRERSKTYRRCEKLPKSPQKHADAAKSPRKARKNTPALQKASAKTRKKRADDARGMQKACKNVPALQKSLRKACKNTPTLQKARGKPAKTCRRCKKNAKSP
jgi:hypothetical protein